MMQPDYRKYGAIGTILFHAVILLLLIVWGLTSIPQEEEGLLVNFGDSPAGQGLEEPQQSEPQTAPEPIEEVTPPPPARATPPTSPTVKESVNTQDFEEAAALREEKKKKAEKERQEKERLKQEAIEAQRIKDAEAKKIAEAKEAERKKQAELARQAAEAKNRVNNAFAGKGTGSSTSEGVTSGSGNQGSLTGDPNSQNRTGTGSGSKGSGFSLAGRSLVGTLPKPSYTIQEEGIVVIEISVDRNGVVTNATPILRGTTTQNSTLWRVATEAARKAKFNADPNAATVQKGTITYHFVLD
ncbi:MAG: TonB family protein [Marinilabiliaceae bacterium]|nr:TonB family protein [Marinilabiliaceae bacterium]